MSMRQDPPDRRSPSSRTALQPWCWPRVFREVPQNRCRIRDFAGGVNFPLQGQAFESPFGQTIPPAMDRWAPRYPPSSEPTISIGSHSQWISPLNPRTMAPVPFHPSPTRMRVWAIAFVWRGRTSARARVTNSPVPKSVSRSEFRSRTAPALRRCFARWTSVEQRPAFPVRFAWWSRDQGRWSAAQAPALPLHPECSGLPWLRSRHPAVRSR